MLTDNDKRELARSYKDAASKVAALAGRIRDEDQQAEAEHREPFTIQPLTKIPAPLVVKACATISGDVSPELAEIIGCQSRACQAIGNTNVYLLSEQLKAILDAAGLTPEPVKAEGVNAEVQGR